MTHYPINRGRRSIRLKGYDYSRAGAYFITICVQNRQCLCGEISDGKMVLNHAGDMIQTVWDQIPSHYTGIEIDEFVVMPNHIHGIIIVGATPRGCPVSTPRGCPVSTPRGCPVEPPHGCHAAPIHRSGQAWGPGHGQAQGPAPTGNSGTLSLGDIVHRFKTMTTKRYADGVKQFGWQSFPGRLWQRNYWEHIIRNEMELDRIREYIRTNPFQWDYDRLNQRDCGPVRPNMVQESGVIYGTERWMV
jgi:putative transposase